MVHVAGLVDELHLAVRPVLLGSGEHLMGGLDLHALCYECARQVAGRERRAVVSDAEWIRGAVRVFGRGIPGQVRVFRDCEIAEAVRWIGE